MEVFVFRLLDVSGNNGIFVTTKGYDSGATKIAEAYRVRILQVNDGMSTPFMGDIHEPFTKEELLKLFPSFKKLDEQTIKELKNTKQHFTGYEEFGSGKSKETAGYKFEAHTYNFAALPNHKVSLEIALGMIFMDVILSAKK